MTKKEIRQKIKDAIASLSSKQRQKLDIKLNRQFSKVFQNFIPQTNKANINILSYSPLSDEPNITNLFKNESRINIFFPVSQPDGTLILRKKSLKTSTGLYKITEPDENSPEIFPENIDLAIIPGRAFTPAGDRIGRGKGYYDRLILALTCPTIALAYNCQLLSELPLNDHDQKVNIVITEDKILTDTNYI